MPPRILSLKSSRVRFQTQSQIWRRFLAYGRYGMDDADLLAGKKCVVTGASRGIGAAIAKCLSDAGASCVLVGRYIEPLEAQAMKIQSSPKASSDGGTRRGWCAAMDVAKREDWENLGKDHRDVDILVNAAGVSHSSLLLATKPALVEKVIQSNLMGTTWGCQIFSKHMIRRHKGCIINVSSLLGVKGGTGSVAYVASKAGILGLTRALAAEIGPSGVRVNAIVPGYIETKMTKDMTPVARLNAMDAIPMGRFGDVEEVAHAALFLVSNPYANNCVLNLDGGLSAT